MKTKLKVFLLISHLTFLGAGTGLGIYLLPILTAQENASLNEINDVKKLAKYKGEFNRNQKGSDVFHWAEGEIYVTDSEIAFKGQVAPGPDYKIYLTKAQAVDKNSFLEMKKEAVLIGELKILVTSEKAFLTVLTSMSSLLFRYGVSVSRNL